MKQCIFFLASCIFEINYNAVEFCRAPCLVRFRCIIVNRTYCELDPNINQSNRDYDAGYLRDMGMLCLKTKKHFCERNKVI